MVSSTGSIGSLHSSESDSEGDHMTCSEAVFLNAASMLIVKDAGCEDGVDLGKSINSNTRMVRSLRLHRDRP